MGCEVTCGGQQDINDMRFPCLVYKLMLFGRHIGPDVAPKVLET